MGPKQYGNHRLAQCLAAALDPAAALRAYEAERRLRTRRGVEQSRWIGTMAQREQAWGCHLRDRLTRMMPTSLAVKQTEWIGRHPV
jgi:2-polyprenyl-6-methoxyphenol hydroxylase-like FAD-dependent oxidoreductase